MLLRLVVQENFVQIYHYKVVDMFFYDLIYKGNRRGESVGETNG